MAYTTQWDKNSNLKVKILTCKRDIKTRDIEILINNSRLISTLKQFIILIQIHIPPLMYFQHLFSLVKGSIELFLQRKSVQL